jgi:hypothetical protein
MSEIYLGNDVKIAFDICTYLFSDAKTYFIVVSTISLLASLKCHNCEVAIENYLIGRLQYVSEFADNHEMRFGPLFSWDLFRDISLIHELNEVHLEFPFSNFSVE